jgi:hypothetical protein
MTLCSYFYFRILRTQIDAVGSVNAHFYAPGVSQLAQVAGQFLPYVHTPAALVLKSVQPAL